MFESLKRIIPAVLAGLLAVSAPPAAHAQLDAAALLRAQQRGENTNLYGTNPFETQDEEGELQDTTKNERRIRKPLESYFFNDSIRALPNFVYHVDREYNRVKIDRGPVSRMPFCAFAPPFGVLPFSREPKLRSVSLRIARIVAQSAILAT